MNLQEYISSGILELYISGALSEQERAEVQAMLAKYPELQDELALIEDQFLQTSAAVAPEVSADFLNNLEKAIDAHPENVQNSATEKNTTPRSNLGPVLSGLAVLSACALAWYSYTQSQDAHTEIAALQQENIALSDQLEDCERRKQEASDVIYAINGGNSSKVVLGGQAIAPNAFATVFWDQESNKVFVDASGLPEPPTGKVYQIWSLFLDPLTPNDAGLLTDFAQNEFKIFEVKNVEDAQGFGITLEPEGGSASPTLSQLYALGTI